MKAYFTVKVKTPLQSLNERTFDKATLKSAYREQAKILHPDAPGGSAERFKELQEALIILEESGEKNVFDDFEFQTGDGSSDWEQMKAQMAQGREGHFYDARKSSFYNTFQNSQSNYFERHTELVQLS